MTTETASEQAGAASVGRTPAYSSYTSFGALLDQLQDNKMPLAFERSYFGNSSGGLIAQTRGTLRFLDLIDEQYRPTDELRALVAADPEGRKAILRRLAEERYPEEIKLAEQSGTHGQLLGLFRERGLTGATAQKAATFFVHVSQDVGLPVSQYFTQRPTPSNGSGTSRRPRRKRAEPSPVVVVEPAAPAETVETKRMQYIDMLMELARDTKDSAADNGAPSTRQDLLNRLEKALGYGEDGGNQS